MRRYPKLQDAYRAMLNDQGLSFEDKRFLALLEQIKRNGITADQISMSESLLANLTLVEIVTLAVGDQEDWVPIYAKLGSFHDWLHEVLDAMFNNVMGIDG